MGHCNRQYIFLFSNMKFVYGYIGKFLREEKSEIPFIKDFTSLVWECGQKSIQENLPLI